jgi:hypothetical protein
MRFRRDLGAAALLSVALPCLSIATPPASAQCVLAPPIPGETQEIFYDTDGLIVHRTPEGKCDGGDTSQREGWYWLGVWIRQNVPGLVPWATPRKLTFDQVLAFTTDCSTAIRSWNLGIIQERRHMDTPEIRWSHW